jgi:hypothetical protein
MPFGHDIVAEAGCIGIFAILINTLYLKKLRGLEGIMLYPGISPLGCLLDRILRG